MSAGLENRSLSEKMIHDIFCGIFAAGSWLKQIELEARYGVSRASIRRALDELTARRYVEHVPNRGYRVTSYSQNQRAELREIRLALELHAAEGILRNAPDDAPQKLRHLAQAFDDALKSGTSVDQMTANGDFHQYLYSLTPNRTLFEELMEKRRRAVAMVATPWSSVREMRKASGEHFEIVAAVERRDLNAMRDAIERHISRPTDQDYSSSKSD